MCELLIRVVDKFPPTGDPRRDAGRSVRGDVIAAVPDGHPWSTRERENPGWVIVRVPGMTEAEGWSFQAGEPGGRSVRARGRPDKYPHTRLFMLDLDALPPLTAGVVLDPNSVRAARLTKPPLAVRG